MTEGQKFIERCGVAIRDLALYHVGIPDDELTLRLNRMRHNLTRDLAPAFGDNAAAMATVFVGAVAARKREIEQSRMGTA